MDFQLLRLMVSTWRNMGSSSAVNRSPGGSRDHIPKMASNFYEHPNTFHQISYLCAFLTFPKKSCLFLDQSLRTKISKMCRAKDPGYSPNAPYSWRSAHGFWPLSTRPGPPWRRRRRRNDAGDAAWAIAMVTDQWDAPVRCGNRQVGTQYITYISLLIRLMYLSIYTYTYTYL